MTDAQEGIADMFDDISVLEDQCRFSNCKHETEPGCAIQRAVKQGDIRSERLARWNKQVAE